MTVVQCRMALAALGWSWAELVAASDVGRLHVTRFLGGGPLSADLVNKLRDALEAEGVHFLMNGPHKGGVVPPRAVPIEDKSGGNPSLRR